MITAEKVAATLRAMGMHDPDDDTVPTNRPGTLWQPTEVVARQLADLLNAQDTTRDDRTWVAMRSNVAGMIKREYPVIASHVAVHIADVALEGVQGELQLLRWLHAEAAWRFREEVAARPGPTAWAYAQAFASLRTACQPLAEQARDDNPAFADHYANHTESQPGCQWCDQGNITLTGCVHCGYRASPTVRSCSNCGRCPDCGDTLADLDGGHAHG
jgi:hypothetical protein